MNTISQLYMEYKLSIKFALAWIISFVPIDIITRFTTLDPNPHVVEWLRLLLLIIMIISIIVNMINNKKK